MWHTSGVLSAPSRRGLLACAAVLVIGVAARLAPWDEVFTSHGVRFVVDTDPHYHVLRAERLLRGEEGAAWFDPRLNHPAGALILWPPGFDALVAGSARLLHGEEPSRPELERVAVFVPVVLGILAVLAQMLFAARWLGRGAAIAAGALAALLPAQVQYGALGFVDQHVAEQLGFCLAVLGLGACATRARWGPVLLGVALAAGPWMWQGAVLTVAFVVLAAAAVFVVRPEGNDAAVRLLRRVAGACAAGGVTLAASMLAWGPPPALRLAGLNGLSWIHPLTAAAGAAGLAVLALFAARRPDASQRRRGVVVGAAAVVGGGAVLLAMPGAVAHGLRSLRATDPWLRTITEFQPALGSIGSFGEDLSWLFWNVGLVLVAPLVGLSAFRRAWSRRADARTALVVLAVGTVAFVGLFLARSRFVVYAAPFLVWWGGLVIVDALERARLERRLTRPHVVAALAVVAFLAPSAHLLSRPFRSVLDEELIGLLTWIRGRETEPRGVLAPWTLGHAVQYHADAPVVTSPFGTDVGAEGMRRLAAFYYAPTLQQAEEVLREGGIGFVLFELGLGGVSDAFPFAPPGAAPVVAEERDYWGEGRSVATLPSFGASTFGALYAADGVPQRPGGGDAVTFLRLVHEVDGGHPFKAFERVEGARVHVSGAEPLAPVSVHVEVVTNARRRIVWSSGATADGEGRASLRVPYATGANGMSTGSAYVAVAGSRMRNFRVEESCVREGLAVDVDLAAVR